MGLNGGQGVAEASQGEPGGHLGKLALEEGLITPEQLRIALAEQSWEASRGNAVRLGSIFLNKGFLTARQIEELLLKDKSRSTRRATPRAEESSGVPSLIGRFRILSEVGRGGMGIVYQAHDPQLERRVALKVVVPSPNAGPQEAALDDERFLREARLGAKLRHPNIVTVYEAGVIEGRRFLSMELILGLPMSHWRRSGSVTIRQQVSLLRDVALAVHHAHQQGIIHRDLKPANILIDSGTQPRVTDFGLAKIVGQNARLSLTAEGRVVGTPAYMSPEQVEGLETVDRRVDVYALGVMLYETLAGKPPFEGQTPVEVMMKVINEPVRPPSKRTAFTMNPFLYMSLEGVCLKAMSKDPRDRYPTAAAMAEDLSKWLKGELGRVSPTRARRVRSRIRAAAFAAIFLVAGGVLGWFLATAGRRAPESAPTAPPESAWKAAIPLIPLVVPVRDAVEGTWAALDGRLVSDAARGARIEIPYEPPEQYDVRVVFTRLSGQRDVNLILTKSGRSFLWLMGAFDNTVFGFELVRGALSNSNPTSRPAGACLENGRRHECIVQVRNAGLKAFLDGRLIVEHRTDYSDLGNLPERSLRDPRLLGVGSFMSPTIFQTIEVLEVTGAGKRTRP